MSFRSPDHIGMHAASPVLRVRCTTITKDAEENRDLITSDQRLLEDVSRALMTFSLRFVTRRALHDALSKRQGRFGYFHVTDADTRTYVAVTVSPDPVLRVRISIGDKSFVTPVLQTELGDQIEEILADAGIAVAAIGEIRSLCAGKENFAEPLVFTQGAENSRIHVRIAYIGSSDPDEQPRTSRPRSRGICDK